MKKIEQKIQQLETTILEGHVLKEKNLLITEMKKIGIEKLPYSYSALKQFIDPETMEFHYNKHYKGYVDKLNDALSKKKYGDLELIQIIKTIGRFDKTIRNNAGGAFNHALFWNMLSPKPKKLKGELYKKITKQYGNFPSFKKEFEKVAKERFGSGWVWLVLTSRNTLKIMSTPNQDNPLMNVIEGGGFPLLGLDLWEHAYYLKYKNKRDEYISNFWKVVNWDFVSKLYEMKTETKLMESTKIKQLLMEGKSEMCSYDENKFYGKLYDTNEKVKWTFRDGMDKILYDVFPDKWVANPGEIYIPGYYDLENPGRSLINNLNTNFSTFCVLVNDINQVIKQIPNASPIDFRNKTPEEQIKETERFLRAINYYKRRIFDVNSSTFKNLLKILDIREKQGRVRENTVSKVLMKNFGDSVSTEMVGGPGIKKDAIGGIDIRITLNGVTKTAQIKSYKSMEITDDNIVVEGNGNVGKYNTDWMIFESRGKVLIFDNKIKEISNGKYVFPLDSLLYDIQ
jgi:superoxide dismutase, Fe-Mn family